MPDRKKILVIDDEADFCLLVKDNLEATQEFDVVTCQDPQEAEGVVSREKPDLILLDNVMPQRSGAQIAKVLKKRPEFQEIPIIMISGRGEMVYIKKKDQFRWLPNTPIVRDRGKIAEGKSPETLSQAYGVDDYVAKPFSTDVLVTVIREVFARSGPRHQSSPPEEPQG